MTEAALGSAPALKQFSYKARNSDGKIVTGIARALTANDVYAEVLRRKLIPLEVKGGGDSGAGLSTEISFRKTAKARDLVLATRQLASMMDSGLNYVEAIDVVRGECEDTILRNALGQVREDLLEGISFAEALKNRGDVFPPVVINLITAGEASGQIRDAMNSVADTLDAADQLKAKIKKAMMYPVIVLVLSAVVFAFMMLYLVPQFSETFEEIGGPGTELPALTQMVVSISDISKILIPIFLVLAVPGFLTYRRVKNRDEVRQVVDPIKMKMPIFGTLFRKLALARFTRNLSGLLGAGVNKVEALEIAARTCGNIMMERAVLAARDAVMRGQPLVTPLKEEPLFPGMLIQFVEAGERSGRTAFMMGKAADIYDRDVDTATDALAAAIEPVFLIALGGMVGVLVIAIYLPYLSIGEAVSG